MLPRRLFNRAFVTVFQQRIAFFVPFVADRRGKYAAATVLTGVTRLCRSFAVFLFVRFLSVPQRAERRFRVFIRQTEHGAPLRHSPLALYTGARLCRTRFGATAFFIFDGKPCRAQPWRFCGIVFPRCILPAVRLRMRHKKSSYKSFKTIRSLCVILTVSIEIYELLILCAAKGVIFTFRKFFLRFYILPLYPSLHCVFCPFFHCAFCKTPCRIARSLSFRVELCPARGSCVLSCLVAATTFLPDVFAVQRHIRADGVFRHNKYLLRYTYLFSRARLSLDNRGVLW